MVKVLNVMCILPQLKTITLEPISFTPVSLPWKDSESQELEREVRATESGLVNILTEFDPRNLSICC